MADTGVVLGDSISELPEPIRHHILSFLNPDDAAKTSVLSKTWLSTWRTSPNLHFVYKRNVSIWRDNNNCNYNQLLARTWRDFINCINTTFLRYHENKYSIDTLDIRLQYDMFPSPMPRPVLLPQTIFDAKSLEKLWLRGKFLLTPQVIKVISCYGLRELGLSGVELDEFMLERIMASCPFIEILEICFCVGFVNVKVTTLQKLKRFTIHLCRSGFVQVEAPSLEDFSYRSILPAINSYDEEELRSLPCWLYMNTCKNLKELCLYKVAITDEFFLGIAENFPQLEGLTIDECDRLRTIKISSHSIKRIHLKPSRDLKVVRIDVPSIDRFEYRGDFIPLFSFTVPSGPWVSDIELSWEKFLKNSWFSELNFMLTKLSTSEISLRIDFPPTAESFIEDEMRNRAIFPLPQVKKLSIAFRKGDCLDAAYLVLDGIFWTCRPKTIDIYWFFPCNNNVVKALVEMLILRRNQKHCNLQENKFWQQDLKDVKIEMFKWGQRVHYPEYLDWETLLKVKDTERLNRGTTLVFDLEWETDRNGKHKRT